MPHAGLIIPAEVADLCRLGPRQIRDDSDEGAAEIFDLGNHAAELVTTDIARAVVDLNRSEDDRRADGVVKTHTCWNVPVYDRAPAEGLIQLLLERYYRPYHARLTEIAGQGRVRLGLDCHTMAAVGPPIGPDPGRKRPWICLSNADGTCYPSWLDRLAECFGRSFGDHVSINEPFRGGFIIRAHAAELPWIQIELSRGNFLSRREKHRRVLQAVTSFCAYGL
ncbi:MAG: N-formylglutamate amidohydrolase [Sedimentisphaerales bacterium]|nr:N-formylglutamate amidohydrolase [Sedimentisphaerales bacterium]